jgi:hypothetical protein
MGAFSNMRTLGNFRVSIFVLALFLAGIVTDDAHARQQTAIPAATLGMTGTADVGGDFVGTFLLSRFDAQNAGDGIVAVGSMHGVVNGRNIVTQLTIPVTLSSAAEAQTTTLTGGSATSCGTVHIDFASAAFHAIGAVVRLDPAGLDIVSSQESTSSAAASASSSLTPTSIAPAAVFRSPAAPSSQAGAAAATTPVGSLTPGVIAPTADATRATATVSPQQLGELICSVSTTLQSSSSPAQVVPLLNQVLVALRQ